MQISRSGFVKRIHHLSPEIFSWFGADNRSSFGDIALEFRVSTMFPSPDTSARATPSLPWVPWPPLAEALRFPTFLATMGFYDLLEIPPWPLRSTLGVTYLPLVRRRSGALFGS